MAKKIILCDVDLTVVNPIPYWWKWLQIQYGYDLDFNAVAAEYTREGKKFPYTVSEAFAKRFDPAPAALPAHFDAADFWRNEGIYDFMHPIPDSVEALSNLYLKGYDIRFVSHCKGNHHKSKYNFIRRNFPFMTGFAATKEKYMLHADIFVDDRNEHLNKMPDNVVKFQHLSPYTQDEELRVGYHNCDWATIYNIITTNEF